MLYLTESNEKEKNNNEEEEFLVAHSKLKIPK